ncbi:hypothetical protein PUNSTDRAFT_27958, partial [Punctularia strigosozonata HHB-11173 SS5]|uniref:uncharacterized protein n=1 Tax=Punctularia strigosozonata (strain HHB-11173) TaxID=741275 RepID=UPI000441769E
LWRLLQHDMSASRDTPGHDLPTAPPPAPVDKSNISARMLLHDTQAQLERFSHRADLLLQGVDDVKAGTSTTQALFKQDREALVDEFVRIASRCQKELRLCLGEPAQASKLNEATMLLSTTDSRLSAL